MMRAIVLVVAILILSSDSFNKCIDNREEHGVCSSNICFSHFRASSEGDLERFDCSEEPLTLNKSTCVQLLKGTDRISACLGDEKEIHCCCISEVPASICASEKRKTAQLTQLWTTSQLLYLTFGHVGLTVVALVLSVFYYKTVHKWPTDNVFIPEGSRVSRLLVSKSLFLLLSLLVLYIPFQKNCMNHPKGIFITPRLFLYQKSVNYINKSGALALTIFELVSVPLLVYDCLFSTVDLWRKDQETRYCKLNGALWQLLLSHFFILVYYILLVIQLVILSKLKQNIDLSPRNSETTNSHTVTICSTQTGEPQIESDFSEAIYIYPRPFHVPRLGLSILNVKNNRSDVWISLRALLSTTGFYKLYPSKFLIPPEKEISIEVEQCTRADSPVSNHNILIEWFPLGQTPISADLQRLWSKPYLIPQSQWQYFVLPVYIDDSTNSSME